MNSKNKTAVPHAIRKARNTYFTRSCVPSCGVRCNDFSMKELGVYRQFGVLADHYECGDCGTHYEYPVCEGCLAEDAAK